METSKKFTFPESIPLKSETDEDIEVMLDRMYEEDVRNSIGKPPCNLPF